LAQQTLQKADGHIATLQAQVVHLTEQAKDKQQEIAIDDYKAETDRLKAVGTIDPVALQMVVRQMVADMLQTDLVHPQLMGHAQDQAEIQQTLAPPEPQPVNGAAANPSQQ
jgi:hypothetical protein